MNPTDPAFPESDPLVGANFMAKPGMDLRTYMATQALAGWMASYSTDTGPSEVLRTKEAANAVADMCVRAADALIERLNAK